MILYLVQQQLLDLPILYLSRHVTGNKMEYYRLLQLVREEDKWSDWVLFILEGIESTARQTISLVLDIQSLMMETKHRIRSDLPKIYSQDLLNNLFRHPYTKIAFVMSDLEVSRVTATKYLESLVASGVLAKLKVGRDNYYINDPLCRVLIRAAKAD